MFVQHVDTNPQLSVSNARLKIYTHHNKSLIPQTHYPQSRRVCYLQTHGAFGKQTTLQKQHNKKRARNKLRARFIDEQIKIRLL